MMKPSHEGKESNFLAGPLGSMRARNLQVVRGRVAEKGAHKSHSRLEEQAGKEASKEASKEAEGGEAESGRRWKGAQF